MAISRRWVLAVLASVSVACTGTNNTPTATPGPATAGAPTQAATPSAHITPSAVPTPDATPTSTPVASGSRPSGSTVPSPSGSAIAGTLAIGDSAAVDPISRAIEASFAPDNPGVTATFTSSEDFGAFCAGQLDAYGASRKIKARGEADVCAQHGVDYVELRIALDAVAIVGSAQDANLICLGFPDVYALLGPESIGVTNWKDATALADTLGSGAEFADAPLVVAGPPPDADASQLLVTAVIAPLAAQQSQAAALRTDYEASADPAAVISAVASPPAGAESLGWLPYAVAAASTDQVKILRLDGGDGCVSATADRILSGAYPISRSLYLYVNLEKADANPALSAYVDTYMGPDALSDALQTLPYIPLPDDVLQDSRFTWQGR